MEGNAEMRDSGVVSGKVDIERLHTGMCNSGVREERWMVSQNGVEIDTVD